MENIDAIFYKKINNGDLWNIDRAPGSVKGGGGQTYINFPIDTGDLDSFLEHAHSTIKLGDHLGRKTYTINAKAIHDFTKSAEITIDPRNNRSDYRITKQALHQDRHPAWLNNETGFPLIDSTASSASTVSTATHLRIYIIRTTDGNYYAGYVNEPTKPLSWPNIDKLNVIFQNDVGIIFFERAHFSENTKKILHDLEKSHNLLLYGPPGTGKTFAMQNVWSEINDNKEIIFINQSMNKPMVQEKIRTEFVTFHQNMNYEEFVIGRQIMPISGGGFSLQPRLGLFLDVAASINQLNEYDKAIIFIDELNRGNVSRIFGQLITFLDGDKRETLKDGSDNPLKLPVPLPEVLISNNKTENIISVNGESVTLEYPYYLPYPIYIVSTMNSVDKAVAPLDSALARRFKKIEYRTDYTFLQKLLSINESTIDYTDTTTWNANTTAYILLRRVNDFIANYFGKEFELGQVYIMPVSKHQNENEKFLVLRDCWEDNIYPQLYSLFSNRLDLLHDFLKVDSPAKPINYPYQFRTTPNGEVLEVLEEASTLDIKSVSDLTNVLRFLAL